MKSDVEQCFFGIVEIRSEIWATIAHCWQAARKLRVRKLRVVKANSSSHNADITQVELTVQRSQACTAAAGT